MISFDLEEKDQKLGASLKVIGIGGAGGNAVNSMIENSSLDSVDYMVANTDAQALSLSLADTKIQLGSKITKGLGAGSKPEVGERAAEEDLDAVMQKISEADILFLTAGLGGGTGSGALPVIAKSAKDSGVLTVAIVTTPFVFEGKRRTNQAQKAIDRLKASVDTLIVVPNQKLLDQSDPKISMLDAFSLSDDILLQGIKGISDIITRAGHINVDFADVREIMHNMGLAIMGTGRADGENRAKEAALKAVSSPLLEDVTIEGAKGVLINITGNTDLGLHEINEAASLIHDMVSEDAEIILGSVIDSNMGNEIMVTVIATGFEEKRGIEQDANKEVKLEQKEEKIEEKPVKNDIDLLIEEHNKNDVKLQASKKEGDTKVFPGNLSDQVFDIDDLDTPTFLRRKAEERSFVKTSDLELKSGENDNVDQANG